MADDNALILQILRSVETRMAANQVDFNFHGREVRGLTEQLRGLLRKLEVEQLKNYQFHQVVNGVERRLAAIEHSLGMAGSTALTEAVAAKRPLATRKAAAKKTATPSKPLQTAKATARKPAPAKRPATTKKPSDAR